MTSRDGYSWKLQNAPPLDIWWKSVTYGNGLFVAAGASGNNNRIMTSPDSVNWTIRTTNNTSFLAITFGNNTNINMRKGNCYKAN